MSAEFSGQVFELLVKDLRDILDPVHRVDKLGSIYGELEGE
jgi:hypothetical protein